MTDQTYNGWTNYETWAVGMYLDGNYDGEGTYRAILELAGAIVREAKETEDELHRTEPLYALEGALEDYVAESMPDLGASLQADLLGAAMSEVNWRELAEHKLAEVAENIAS